MEPRNKNVLTNKQWIGHLIRDYEEFVEERTSKTAKDDILFELGLTSPLAAFLMEEGFSEYTILPALEYEEGDDIEEALEYMTLAELFEIISICCGHVEANRARQMTWHANAAEAPELLLEHYDFVGMLGGPEDG